MGPALYRWSISALAASVVMIALFLAALRRTVRRVEMRWWTCAWMAESAALAVVLAAFECAAYLIRALSSTSPDPSSFLAASRTRRCARVARHHTGGRRRRVTLRRLPATLIVLWLGVLLHAEQREWYAAAQARTAIGLSRDGRTLTLFTVDKSGGSEGMQVGEIADLLLRDYGVRNALNLDGGGSTTTAMEDPETHAASMVSASSDRDPVAGRAVGSSLAVFVRPNP